jgi:hypothetical protein
MSPLTPKQHRNRERVESVIRLMAPGLNIVLAAGERLSRIVEPEDAEYYPVRTHLPQGDEQPRKDRTEPA